MNQTTQTREGAAQHIGKLAPRTLCLNDAQLFAQSVGLDADAATTLFYGALCMAHDARKVSR